MSGDNSTEVERKRRRAAEASSWKNSVERLKAIRQGGLGNLSASGGGYDDIKLEQPFDDGDEYDAIVSLRRRGFVGEEQDWSKPSGPESTDESEDDGGFSGRVKKKGKEEAAQVKKVNPWLKAAATISSLKKGKESILEEVLAKVNPDDMDRERHRRRKQPSRIHDSVDKCDHVAMENELMKEQEEEEDVTVTLPQTSENMELPSVIVEGSNNIKQSEEAKAESGVKKEVNATVDTKEKEAMCKGGTENGAEFDLDADGSLRFYILDAYEEAFGASMGTVYLFGKVSLLEFHSF